MPYLLSAVAAVIYIVATFALATNRRRLALVTVGIELVGVLTVGLAMRPGAAGLRGRDPSGPTSAPATATCRSLLPFVGLWWLWRQGRAREEVTQESW